MTIHDDWTPGVPPDYDEPVDGGVSERRLDHLLENWCEWMNSGKYGQGYPRKSPGLKGTGAEDWDEKVEQSDLKAARTMDAIIDSIDANERIAVYHHYRLSVWRLREPMHDVFLRARTSIRTLLKARRVE